MFKLIAIALIGLGIYIGINYTDEINAIVESDGFEQVQEKIAELIDNKDEIIEQIKAVSN